MKKVIIALVIMMSAQFAIGQINAITETGDEVILYQDGTWNYLNGDIIEDKEIPINKKKYSKDNSSTFLVKSKKLNIGIWINPKSWSFTKGADNEDAEFEFQKKGDDLYAMLISEKIQIPVETLREIAFENAKAAAPDVKIIKEEYRNVNGIKVLMMQMSGTIQGMRFTYYGYYYSNSNGTIQLLTYTGDNLFNEYIDDIELFLNGLVEQ